MLRALKLVGIGAASLVVVAFGSILLFWLGRSQPPAEVIVTSGEDFEDDDPGEDVDE